MSFAKIGVIGAGSFGTAMANVLAAATTEAGVSTRVLLWGREREQIEACRRTRMNALYLPGVPLHDGVEPTPEFAELRDAEVLFVVVPSRAIREVADRLAAEGVTGALVSCTKGIERGTGLRMTEVLKERLPMNTVAVLSGPSHAEEASQGMPTAVVLGCEDEGFAARLQRMMTAGMFRVYTSTDVAGVELGGALKNIFAIAAGISDGLGFGDNSKAALVTRSLVELARLGEALGGRPETFYGLSGLGDLMVTCFSRHSRNRALGERIGRGEKLEEIVASMSMVAEGVPTTRSAYECARQVGVDTPIIDAVYRILYEGLAPRKVLAEMLSRHPKPELRR